MSVMVRKQVYIEPRQETQLKQRAAETGMSEAEIIRQAIDHWLEEEARRQRAAEAWEKARVLMEDRYAQGAVPGGRTWTRDELYAERMGRYDHDNG
jgi:predicted DNA-binding protein